MISTDTFEGIEANRQRELDRTSRLLKNSEIDLEAYNRRVRSIHEAHETFKRRLEEERLFKNRSKERKATLKAGRRAVRGSA